MIKRFKKYVTSLVEQKVTEAIKKELGRKPEKKVADFNLFADTLNRVMLDSAAFIFDDGKSATGVFKTIEDLEKKITELEQVVKKGIEDGTKARKEMEKYLGITYVQRETKTEGYEKSPAFVSSGYMSACSGGPDVQWGTMTTAGVCEKKKRTRKVAKKSKKK